MSRMQEDIQYAGSDTRPPMLDRTDFESWQQRIRLYCLGKDNGENIMKSIKEGPFQMGTVSDVITGGTEGAVQQGPVRARVLNDLSAEEKERYKADIRATNILLQGIPKDIYSLINHYTDAKDIWENEMILGSYTAEYETLRQIKGEGIQGYNVGETADECDAFDSDVDEGPMTQTMFMASLTSEDPIYDEAGPSYDSNNPLEVIDHDAFVDHMDEYHDVHEMQNDVQHNYVVDSDADYTSDSNIIPYDQYVEDNEEHVVPCNASSVRNDALMSILDEMHEQGVQSRLTNKPDMLMNDSVTSELARYKELVGEYEKRAKILSNKKSSEFIPVGVNDSTEASGSKPRCNTKKNRILPAKKENKKEVEVRLRTNKSVWTKVNRVDSSISSKRVVINSNSESVNSASNEMCVVNVLNSVNATPTVRIVLHNEKQIWKPKGKLSYNSLNTTKQIWKPKSKLSDNSLSKTQRVWKATGKLFADIGYQWRPTGKKFALGEICQLTKLSVKCSTLYANQQVMLWYLDSGCSKHMTGNRSKLVNFVEKFIGSVRFGNDHLGAIMGYGDYVMGDSVISRVYYVEGLGHNLFFVGQFCDSDLEVAFRKHTCFVRDIKGTDILKGSRGTNLYTISIDEMMKSSPICLLSKASKSKSWLWHRRLNHLNFGTINDLARKDLVRGLPRLKFEKDHLCSACQLGKSKKFSHRPKSENTNMEVLHTLHMDLCGPMRVQSIKGKKYILVIVDDYSRFTWVKFLRSKDETPEFVTNFLKQIQVGLNKTVRFIRTDNGTEFVNQVMSEYYEGVGIFHQKSVPRTPQQNGVVERRNRTLVEAARTMMIFSKAPMFLWAEAVATACYTQNRSLIHTRHNKTPYELVHDKKPDLTFFRVFGALCYPTNDSENLGKFQAKADIGIFVGYAPSRKGYRIYNKRTRRLMETIHVTFDEMHQSMAPVRMSSGPEPFIMTPGQLKSGLAPTDKELEMLFQPMFDEHLEQSRGNEPVPSAAEITAHVVPPGTSLSTTIALDAPSTSASSSTSDIHHPVQHQEIAEEPTHEDTPINHDVLHPSHNLLTGDPGSAQSSSGNVNSAEPIQENPTSRLSSGISSDGLIMHLGRGIQLSKFLDGKQLLQGLQVSQSPGGIFINQAKYALETLKKYGMDLSDPVDTPMVDRLKLEEDLMGLQYQAKPTKKHFDAIKRGFRTVKGTIHWSLYPKDYRHVTNTLCRCGSCGSCQDSRRSYAEVPPVLEMIVSSGHRENYAEALAISTTEA
ncbi:retrovirus-related pol polyprotein from transposon TNT 1-94 [Tanacetum coccineum]